MKEKTIGIDGGRAIDYNESVWELMPSAESAAGAGRIFDMIKSMTGFGRCENHQGSRKFTVEMKAVNHRYFDVSIKMPKKLGFFEAAIRGVLKQYVQRGKLDVFVTYEDYSEGQGALKYNEEIAAEYLKYFRRYGHRRGGDLGRAEKDPGGCLRAVCTGQRAGRRGFESRSA